MILEKGDFTKALLISGDEEDRDAFKNVLTSRTSARFGNYFLEVAQSVPEAKKMTELDRHDVYFINYHLQHDKPALSGLAFLNELLANPRHPPVIIVSEHAEIQLSTLIQGKIISGSLHFLHKAEITANTVFGAIDRLIGRFLRVLVLEDDADDLEMLKYHMRLAQNYRFNVHWARDVNEARGEMESHKFNAVILDYRMPSGTSMELIDELTDKNPDMPLVLFTGIDGMTVGESIIRLIGRRKLEFLSKRDLNAIKLINALDRAERAH